jgi:hypothetical protein
LYRDNRVNKWAKCIGGGVMAEKNYHSASCDALKRELWANIPQPDQIKDLEELVKSPRDKRASFFRRSFSFENRKSNDSVDKSPTPEKKGEESVKRNIIFLEEERANKRILKQGQLLRLSGKGATQTKKGFWFVLFEDGTLEYFTDPNTVVSDVFSIVTHNSGHREATNQYQPSRMSRT